MPKTTPFLSLLLVVTVLAGSSSGAVSLSLDEVSGRGTVTVPLRLTATGGDSPANFSVELEFDETLVSFSGVRDPGLPAGKTLASTALAPGRVRLVLTGASSTALPDGPVALLDLTFLNPLATGDTASLALAAPLMFSTVGGSLTPSLAGAEVVFRARPGDINRDDQSNVVDVQSAINMALGVLAVTPAGDLNGDGSVNVTDVQLIINIALGQPFLSAIRPDPAVIGAPLTLFGVNFGTSTAAAGVTLAGAPLTVTAISDEELQIAALPTGSTAGPLVLQLGSGRPSNSLAISVVDSLVLSVGDTTAEEGESLVFPISLSRAATAPISVDVATSDGTALAGEDYSAFAGTITIPAGQTAAVVIVDTLEGATPVHEGPQTLTVTLSNSSGGGGPILIFGQMTGSGTIQDDDPLELSIADSQAEEGDSGTSVVTLPITLNIPSESPIEVTAASLDNTATVADGDYTALAATAVTFPAMTTAASITLTINGDTTAEPSELALVELSAPRRDDGQGFQTASDVTLAKARGEALIVDDEGPGEIIETFTDQLGFAFGLAFDGPDLLVVDNSARKVFRLTPAGGTPVVVAGSGIPFGDIGDGGLATAARLNGPTDVAVDSAGNILITDTSHDRLRRIDAQTGVITTIAGDGTSASTGDGGPAAAARLAGPFGLAIAGNGDIYVSENLGHRVRRIDAATGLISTVAGNGSQGSTGDGGPATAASLDQPGLIDLAPNGDLYITTTTVGRQVRRVDGQTGVITTFAGTGSQGSGTGDGGPAVDAHLKAPVGVKFEGGSVFFTDFSDHRLRRVSPAGIISTYAGDGSSGFSGDGGPPESAQIGSPFGLAFGPDESLYVSQLNRIRRVTGRRPLQIVTRSLPELTLGVGVNLSLAAEGNKSSPRTWTLASGSLPPGLTLNSGTSSATITGAPTTAGLFSFVVEVTDANGRAMRRAFSSEVIAPALDVTAPRRAAVEGEALAFRVTLSAPTQATVTVLVSTVDDSAVAGSDFTAVQTTVTFAPGETEQTVTVPLLTDGAAEGTETFRLELSAPAGATLGTAIATGTALDADSPTLVVDELSVGEADGTVLVPVRLTTAAAGAVTVDVATDDDSAAAPGDFAAVTTSLTFAPGETMKTVAVDVAPDDLNEATERLLIRLSNAAGAELGHPESRLTIADDDPVAVSVGDLTVVEGDVTGTASVTVSLDHASQGDIVVEAATMSGTASAPGDFVPLNQTLSVPAGTTTLTVPVAIVGDDLNEATESFTVALSNAVGGAGTGAVSIGTAQATVLIQDDDAITVTIADGSLIESGGALAFPVSLDHSSQGTVTVEVATADGSAAAPADYSTVSGTLTFAPGETQQTVLVPVTDDDLNEPTETLMLQPGQASGDAEAGLVSVGAAAAGTISDDDPVTITIDDGLATEVDSGTTPISLVLTLDRASQGDVSVDVTTSDGTAMAGSDYQALMTTTTVPAGMTTAVVTVEVLGDTIGEPVETFTVSLSQPGGSGVGQVLATDTATGTIIDNDSVGISIGDLSVTEGAATASLPITLSQPAAGDITLSFQTLDDTATAPADYTAASGSVTIPAGQVSAGISIAFPDDATNEADESLTVQLSNISGGGGDLVVFIDDEGRLTLEDDDPITVAVADATALEGTGTISLDLTLDRASAGAVSIDLMTLDGSATAGDDYMPLMTTVTFAPGEQSRSLSVSLIDDTINEPTKLLMASLSNPSAGQGAGQILAAAPATLIILDNDALEVTVSDQVINEGDGSGVVNASLTLTLSRASARPIRVALETVDGTATVADQDYVALMQDVDFVPGTTTASVTLTIQSDDINEAEEQLRVELTPARDDGAGFVAVPDVTAAPPAVITIVNDDQSEPMIETVFGGGTELLVDGALATSVQSPPTAMVAVDGAGRLYVARVSGTRVYRVDPSGVLTRYAGDGFSEIGFAGNGDPATDSSIGVLSAIAVSSSGVLYTSGLLNDFFTANTGQDFNRLRRVDTGGIINSIANARPAGLAAVDGMRVLGSANHRVREYSASGGSNTIAGTSTAGFQGDGGPAMSARLRDPAGVAVDSDGNLYIADAGNNRVRRVDAVTGVITTIAGNGSAGFGGDGGPATGAALKPVSVAVDRLGHVYISTVDHRVRRVDARTSIITTFAGTGVAGFNGDGQPASAAQLDGPLGLAVGPNGRLHIADSTNARVRRVTNGSALTILTDALPTPSVAAPYSAELTGYGGAGSGYSWSVVAGTLPPGLTLSATGTPTASITGTPTTGGDFSVRVQLTDPDGNTALADYELSFVEGISIAEAAARLEGGGQSLDFAISLTAIDTEDVTVELALSGTATAGSDYTTPPTSVTIPAGQLSRTVSISLLDDGAMEGNESILVTLQNPTNGRILSSTATGLIFDDESPTNVLFDPSPSVGESAGMASLTVSLFAPLAQPATLDFVTAAGTASGTDFTAQSGTLNFAPGETQKTIMIPISGDGLNEADETFECVFSNPTGSIALMQGDRISVSILDDDPVELRIHDASIDEDGGLMDFEVTLSGPSQGTISVFQDFRPGGTAKPAGVSGPGPEDWNSGNGTVSFAPGVLSLDVGSIFITDDDVHEMEEFLLREIRDVSVSAEAGAVTIARPVAMGVIRDNDPLLASISDAGSIPEGDGGSTTVDFTITLDRATQHPIRMTASTIEGSASAADGDFVALTQSLNFAAGPVAQPMTITVEVNGDMDEEPTEALVVELTGLERNDGQGFTAKPDVRFAKARGDVQIVDDDGDSELAIVTIAGTGATGFNGDGIDARLANLDTLLGLTVDGAGNILLADHGQFRIRRIDATTGQITTFAGDGVNDITGDGGQAVDASIGRPTDLVFTASGDLYFSANDGPQSDLRRVRPNGIISTATGTFGPGWLAAGGGEKVFFSVSSRHEIRFLDLSVSPGSGNLAGRSISGFGGDGQSVNVSFNTPTGLVKSGGQLFIADTENQSIRVIDLSTRIVQTYAGVSSTLASGQRVGLAGSTGDGGLALDARLNHPVGLTVDARGRLYIAERDGHRIRRIDPTTGIISTVAGVGSSGFSGDGGPARAAQLSTPRGLAFDPVRGRILIADSDNRRVRALTGLRPLEMTTGLDLPLAVAGDSYSATLTMSGGSELGYDGRLVSGSLPDGLFFESGDDSVKLAGTPTLAGDFPFRLEVRDTLGRALLRDYVLTVQPRLDVLEPRPAVDLAGTTLDVTLQLSAPSSVPVTLRFQTFDSSARAGTNYVEVDETLTIPAGVQSEVVSIPLIMESNNTGLSDLLVRISEVTGAVAGTTQVFGLIVGNSSPDPRLFISDVTVDEAAGVAQVTAQLLPAPTTSVSFDLITTDGTALAGMDYTAPASTMSFPAGSDSQTIAVTLLSDGLNEPSESFTVTLSNPSSVVSIFDGEAEVTIRDADPCVVMISSGVASEDDPASQTVTLDVTLSTPSQGTVEVGLAAAGRTATQGTDFLQARPTVIFAPGETQKTITIEVLDDELNEPTETIEVDATRLQGSATGALTMGARGQIAITDDDPVALSLRDANPVVEGGTLTFELRLDRASERPLRVRATTRDNSATVADADYTMRTADLELAAGQLSTTLTIATSDDSDPEPNELLQLELSLPERDDGNGFAAVPDATIGRSTADGLVIDDDAAAETLAETEIIAGGGFQFPGDGSPATDVELDDIEGLAWDSAGNLFISNAKASYPVVRRVDAQTGIITTFAGSGTGGDGIPATTSLILFPFGLAVDSADNLFIAETAGLIRRVDRQTGIIDSFAGAFGSTGLGDGGLATAAGLNDPRDVAFDAQGHLFIADHGNNRIRRVDAQTGIITTVAGGGTQVATGIPATDADLEGPTGLVISASGQLYFACSRAHRIWRVDSTTGQLTLIAGRLNGQSGFAGDVGPATEALFDEPTRIALDPTERNLFLTDQGNRRIRRIELRSGFVFPLAGPTFRDVPGALAVSPEGRVAYAGPVGMFGHAAVRRILRPVALRIVEAGLPTATLNSAYQAELTINGGSQSGYSWSLTSGTLPAGLTLNSGSPDATITGTPTETGSFPIELEVTDGAGNRMRRRLTLEVQP